MTRNEQQIIQDTRILLNDTMCERWSERHLTVLFSLGLTNRNIPRQQFYGEAEANQLIEFILLIVISLTLRPTPSPPAATGGENK